MRRPVFFLSDRTGITAETLGRTLLTQFETLEFEQVPMPFIDTPEKARQAVAAINRTARNGEVRPLVFSTFVDNELRAELADCEAAVFDLFEAFMGPLERELGMESAHVAGRSHGLVDDRAYAIRIDAVNYALHHDDGLVPTAYDEADLVLVGVSRSGKTPTCLYLALNYGIWAANYPLTEEDMAEPRLPDRLKPFRDKLFGLTIQPERLHRIRSERRPNTRYASLRQCQLEARQAEQLFKRERLPYLDSTTISVEEIATTVMHRTQLMRRA